MINQNEALNQNKTSAIELGETALNELSILLKTLNSAKRWGTFDVFSNNLMSTMIKRHKLKDSEEITQNTKIAVENFKNVIASDESIRLDNEDILSNTKTIDYLFGVFGNMFVLEKIKSNIEQTEELYNIIDTCVQELKSKNS